MARFTSPSFATSPTNQLVPSAARWRFFSASPATGASAAASHWLVFQADASSAAVRTPAAPHVFPAGQPAAMPAPAQSARASPIIVFMFMLSLSPV